MHLDSNAFVCSSKFFLSSSKNKTPSYHHVNDSLIVDERRGQRYDVIFAFVSYIYGNRVKTRELWSAHQTINCQMTSRHDRIHNDGVHKNSILCLNGRMHKGCDIRWTRPQFKLMETRTITKKKRTKRAARL